MFEQTLNRMKMMRHFKRSWQEIADILCEEHEPSFVRLCIGAYRTRQTLGDPEYE